MSLTLIIAVALVFVASMGLLAVGAAYRWDLTAKGYALWTRVIGVVTVIGLALDTAWSRRDEPLVAGLVLAGGVALAVVFVLVHRRLTERLKAVLKPPESS